MLLKLSSSRDVLATIGARLRAQRLAQSIQQGELAAMAGVSRSAVASLESTGRSSLETFVRVLRALDLVGELEPLFLLPKQSIADMERASKVPSRKRVRRPKKGAA